MSLVGAAAHQSSSLLLLKGETGGPEPEGALLARGRQAAGRWPLVLAHGGRVPQEPALHAVLTEALSSHEPLRSQVALLAKGRSFWCVRANRKQDSA